MPSKENIMLKEIIESTDSYKEKLEQTTVLIADYLSLHPSNTYHDFVHDNVADLMQIVGDVKHPWDIIGKITSDAVIAKDVQEAELAIKNIETDLQNETDQLKRANLNKKLMQWQNNELVAQEKLKLNQRMYDYIVNNNVANVTTEERIYSQGYTKSQGTTFTPVREKIVFDSNPTLFCQQTNDPLKDAHKQVLFRTLLEHTRRHKSTTTSTFKQCPVERYNLAPDTSKWLQPIYGQEHHEFFDLVFEAVAPDPLARQNVLDSLAFKLVHPHLNRLASPIFAGVGGTGKSSLGRIFNTMTGTGAVNWKAKITEDTMKNTGSLFEGKLFINFDEMNCIRMNSPEYIFVKEITHTDYIKSRNLHSKMSDIENSTWIWYSGNPGDERSPVPLLGEKNNGGVDRRFTPIISTITLVDLVMQRKDMTNDEAKAWLDIHWNTTVYDDTEVAKFMGNIITASNVLNLTENDYPRAYHGPDYKALSGNHASQIAILAEHIYTHNPAFVNLSDAYKAYCAMCDNDGVDKRYRKQKQAFTDALSKVLTEYFTDSAYGRFNLKGGGQSTGWKLNKNGPNPLNDFKLSVTDEHQRIHVHSDHKALLDMDADLIAQPTDNKQASTPQPAKPSNVVSIIKPKETIIEPRYIQRNDYIAGFDDLDWDDDDDFPIIPPTLKTISTKTMSTNDIIAHIRDRGAKK